MEGLTFEAVTRASIVFALDRLRRSRDDPAPAPASREFAIRPRNRLRIQTMRGWPLLALALLGCCFSSLGCRSPYYADRGALTGGLAGAGLGAVIGDASGNAGPGAVLGAAVGALTGNVIGEGIDADMARSRAEVEARMGRQMSGAVATHDVVAMTQAGLSEDVISTYIRTHGVAQPPTAADLINLRNQGVSDRVLQALQQTPSPVAPVAYAAAPPREVVVEQYYGPGYYGPGFYSPAYCPPPAYLHYHHHRHRRHGPSWGFSVGH
jgi:hypothetical protein